MVFLVGLFVRAILEGIFFRGLQAGPTSTWSLSCSRILQAAEVVVVGDLGAVISDFARPSREVRRIRKMRMWPSSLQIAPGATLAARVATVLGSVLRPHPVSI